MKIPSPRRYSTMPLALDALFEFKPETSNETQDLTKLVAQVRVKKAQWDAERESKGQYYDEEANYYNESHQVGKKATNRLTEHPGTKQNSEGKWLDVENSVT